MRNLREAVREAERLGAEVVKIPKTGEIRFSAPGHRRLRVNCRRKCTPKCVISLIRKLRKEEALQ